MQVRIGGLFENDTRLLTMDVPDGQEVSGENDIVGQIQASLEIKDVSKKISEIIASDYGCFYGSIGSPEFGVEQGRFRIVKFSTEWEKREPGSPSFVTTLSIRRVSSKQKFPPFA